MVWSKEFRIGDKTLFLDNCSFQLGELSTQVLNITPEDFAPLRRTLKSALSALDHFEEKPDASGWDTVLTDFGDLHKMLMEDPVLFYFAPDEEWLDEIKEDMKEPVAVDLSSDRWDFCRSVLFQYDMILSDIAAFNTTIHNFINGNLQHLKKLDSENYAAALYDFLFGEGCIKRIANPLTESAVFTNADAVKVRYVPVETPEGLYTIHEVYEAYSVQAVLKTDFYKALQTGYVIRRCAYCGRYFLLTKAYHTKYCDTPAPNDPSHTCAQLGYHSSGIKELAGDNPKARSLHRCHQRVDKDYYRGIISEEERNRLLRYADDLYYRATRKAGVSNEELESQLSTQELYSVCEVERVTAPRGRPRKERKSEQ